MITPPMCAQVMETMPLPANRDEITVECTRDFLVEPPAAGTGNAAPRPEHVQCTPVPVPPGLNVMEANVYHLRK